MLFFKGVKQEEINVHLANGNKLNFILDNTTKELQITYKGQELNVPYEAKHIQSMSELSVFISCNKFKVIGDKNLYVIARHESRNRNFR